MSEITKDELLWGGFNASDVIIWYAFKMFCRSEDNSKSWNLKIDLGNWSPWMRITLRIVRNGVLMNILQYVSTCTSTNIWIYTKWHKSKLSILNSKFCVLNSSNQKELYWICLIQILKFSIAVHSWNSLHIRNMKNISFSLYLSIVLRV
jgi:hypothetical protein